MLTFERLQTKDHTEPLGLFYRTRISGGWLVTWEGVNRGHGPAGAGMTFVYDPEHQWDGSSLPEDKAE